MKTVTFLLVLQFSAIFCADFEIIANFLKKNVPLKVVGFFCWRPDDIVRFSKRLSKEGISIAVNYKTDDLTTFLPEEHQFYLLDANCFLSPNILLKANNTGLLKFPNRWLILQCNSSSLQQYDIYLNSRVYTLCGKNIKALYKIKREQVLDSNDIASWNGRNFDYYNQLVDSKNRSDLKGLDMNISVVTVYEESMKHLDDFRDRNRDAISKHNYVLVNHIADVLNVSRQYRFHRTWGTRIPNTTLFTGEIGDLQLRLAELGGTAAFVTTERIPLVDFVGATTPTRAKFIFRAPALSMVANVFILPFGTNVWYACYVTVAVIFVVVFIISKWEWTSSFERTLDEKREVLRPTILDVVQLEVGAIFQQGAEAEPKSSAGRIATFIIFLSLMFLYTSYCANIVALLQSTTDSIRTLDDLLTSKIQLGVEETPYSRYYFLKQQGESQLELYRKKIAPPNRQDSFMTVHEGVEKMRTEFFAFHAECDTIYKRVSGVFLESEKCGLTEIVYWSGIVDPYVPITKNSTFKELIKVGFAKLYERGLQMRNFRRFYTKKPTCQNQGANFISVSLHDCYFAVLAFGAGTGVSLAVFFLEIVIQKYVRRPKIRQPYTFAISEYE